MNSQYSITGRNVRGPCHTQSDMFIAWGGGGGGMRDLFIGDIHCSVISKGILYMPGILVGSYISLTRDLFNKGHTVLLFLKVYLYMP